MALGRYSRIDNSRRQGTSYCSTVTIVVFVGLCLVGVWMMTSSSVVPGQTADDPADAKKNEVKQEVTKSGASTTKQFEDSQGDLPEDATKGENNTPEEKPQESPEVKTEEKPNENPEVKTKERPSENPEEKPEANPEEKPGEETKSDEGSNTEKQNGESNADEGDSKTNDGETNIEDEPGKSDDGKSNAAGQGDSEENSPEKNPETNEAEVKSDENFGESEDGETGNNQTDEMMDQKDNKELDKSPDGKANNQSSDDLLPSGAQSELLNETTTQSGSWSTQAAESKNEKEAQQSSNKQQGYNWKLCNVTAGPDYIPCLDNLQAIKSLRSTKHYEHRERHCPEESPTCLVSLSEGYKRPIEWPASREKVSCMHN